MWTWYGAVARRRAAAAPWFWSRRRESTGRDLPRARAAGGRARRAQSVRAAARCTTKLGYLMMRLIWIVPVDPRGRDGADRARRGRGARARGGRARGARAGLARRRCCCSRRRSGQAVSKRHRARDVLRRARPSAGRGPWSDLLAWLREALPATARAARRTPRRATRSRRTRAITSPPTSTSTARPTTRSGLERILDARDVLSPYVGLRHDARDPARIRRRRGRRQPALHPADRVRLLVGRARGSMPRRGPSSRTTRSGSGPCSRTRGAFVFELTRGRTARTAPARDRDAAPRRSRPTRGATARGDRSGRRRDVPAVRNDERPPGVRAGRHDRVRRPAGRWRRGGRRRRAARRCTCASTAREPRGPLYADRLAEAVPQGARAGDREAVARAASRTGRSTACSARPWRPGEIVADSSTFAVPRDLVPGRLRAAHPHGAHAALREHAAARLPERRRPVQRAAWSAACGSRIPRRRPRPPGAPMPPPPPQYGTGQRLRRILLVINAMLRRRRRAAAGRLARVLAGAGTTSVIIAADFGPPRSRRSTRLGRALTRSAVRAAIRGCGSFIRGWLGALGRASPACGRSGRRLPAHRPDALTVMYALCRDVARRGRRSSSPARTTSIAGDTEPVAGRHCATLALPACGLRTSTVLCPERAACSSTFRRHIRHRALVVRNVVRLPGPPRPRGGRRRRCVWLGTIRAA